MSIFNFRRGRPATDAPAGKRASAQPAPESVELIRKRARQRLTGAAVLVLIGVVGFPLLFESQPRPVPVDIPIEIPSRASIKPAAPVEPLTRPASVPAGQAAASAALASASEAPLQPQASLGGKEEIVSGDSPAPRTAPKPEDKPEPAAAARPDVKARADDGQRAKALLEGAADPAAPAEPRIVVQVGAFSDPAKAREARSKLEKAGLKTYTQMADTKDGTRIRVRVGPFASKAEAEKAAAKIKSLNLPAAILVL